MVCRKLAKKESSILRLEGRLKASSFRQYLYYFNDFLGWLNENGGEFRGFGPDDLIEYQKRHPGRTGIIFLILFRCESMIKRGVMRINGGSMQG